MSTSMRRSRMKEPLTMPLKNDMTIPGLKIEKRGGLRQGFRKDKAQVENYRSLN